MSEALISFAVMAPRVVTSQKHTDEYSAVHGGKWGLEMLSLYVEATRGRAACAALFRDIREVLRHSLLAVQPRMAPEARTFELYGYDIIVDSSLRPWLCEVNASPSLSATTPEDLSMKTELISDVMDVAVRDFRLLPTRGRQGPVAPSGGGGMAPASRWAAHLCHASDITAPPGSPLGGFEVLIDEARGWGCGFETAPSAAEPVPPKPADVDEDALAAAARPPFTAPGAESGAGSA